MDAPLLEDVYPFYYFQRMINNKKRKSRFPRSYMHASQQVCSIRDQREVQFVMEHLSNHTLPCHLFVKKPLQAQKEERLKSYVYLLSIFCPIWPTNKNKISTSI